MQPNTFYCGDAREILVSFKPQIFNTCVTSTPYYGLRDYGVKGQYGLESTPEEFIHNQVQVFEEVKRTLRDDGTLWLNIGDSYWGGKGLSGAPAPEYQAQRSHLGISMNKKYQQVGTGPGKVRITDKKHPIIKAKDLIGIPWKLAFALRDYGAADLNAVKVLEDVMRRIVSKYAEAGQAIPDKILAVIESMMKEYGQAKGKSWYLRQDIVWHKPNPMPESIKDRCTRSHEFIFLLSKQKKYYFDADAIRTPYIDLMKEATDKPITGFNDVPPGHVEHSAKNKSRKGFYNSLGANRRDVWTISVKPIAEAHFATFPEDIPDLCIKAGCPKGGIVVDPYMGAGATAISAVNNGCKYVGVDINPKNIGISKRQMYKELGMFAK